MIIELASQSIELAPSTIKLPKVVPKSPLFEKRGLGGLEKLAPSTIKLPKVAL